MKRVSDLETAEEIELEQRREHLRDRRWARHRDQLKFLVLTGLSFVAPSSLLAVLQQLGVGSG